MADEKILKSEELTDAELDNVAGGLKRETAQDAEFLRAAGLLPIDAEPGKYDLEAVRVAFAKQKVTLIEHNDDVHTNSYYMNGKSVNRVDVLRQIAKNKKMKNFDINQFM